MQETIRFPQESFRYPQEMIRFLLALPLMRHQTSEMSPTPEVTRFSTKQCRLISLSLSRSRFRLSFERECETVKTPDRNSQQVFHSYGFFLTLNPHLHPHKQTKSQTSQIYDSAPVNNRQRFGLSRTEPNRTAKPLAERGSIIVLTNRTPQRKT